MALFQLVGQAVPEARVLDLYAGTGALGVETLSRGAAEVDFVEQDPKLCKAIERNFKSGGFSDRVHVYRTRVEKALTFLEGPYDLVLVDPPYQLPGLPSVLETLGHPGLIRAGGVLTVEHSIRVGLEESYEALNRVDQRNYGDTALSVYNMEKV